MDSSRILRRIRDNLIWHGEFGPPAPCNQADVERQIAALWEEPNEQFVAQLYLLLLGRTPDRAGLAALCDVLETGASRSAVARRLARSEEARGRGLDDSWLPPLAKRERAEVVRKLRALWPTPAGLFVGGVYLILLGREADPEGRSTFQTLLEAGAPRSTIVRMLARSVEARALGLDVSWLSELAVLDQQPIWRKLRALWRAPTGRFVDRLYMILLGRPADAAGAAGFRALLTAGASRFEVLRRIALSEEAQEAGLDVSWLPRLAALERAGRRSTFGSLKSLFRRWLAGPKVVAGPPRESSPVRV
jgi:hypothetical protein